MHSQVRDTAQLRSSDGKLQLESFIAVATQKIQLNPLWEMLSKLPSYLLKQHNGLSTIAKNAGRPLNGILPLQQHQTPLLACLSTHYSSSPGDCKHLFDIALSNDDISEKLEGIPVYAVCKNSSEFVLVSDAVSQKSLGFFCFRQRDAESLLQQVQAREPLTGKGARVIAVSLNKVYKLHAAGVSFKFLPDPQQVKNALEVAQGSQEKSRSFDGVPIFQSSNLIVRSNDVRYCPVFFCKEDLDLALQTASKLQQKINPALQVNTDIQVGSFEQVLKQMKGSIKEQEWVDVVFIPPGMTSLGQLENINKSTIGCSFSSLSYDFIFKFTFLKTYLVIN